MFIEEYKESLLCHVKNRDISSAKVLLEENKTNIDWDDNKALYLACENIDLEMIQLLLENCPELSYRCIYKVASSLNKENTDVYIKIIKLLFRKNMNIEYINKLFSSIVNLDLYKLLLSYGADVNYQQKFGTAALLSAAYSNDVECVKFLIENHADINLVHKFYGSTALSETVNINSDIVFFLLEHGANINHQNKDKNFLLQNALYDSESIFKKLLSDYNLDIDLQDKYGNSTVMLAVLFNKNEMLRLLLNKNVNLSIKNNEGNTALMLAVIRKHKDIVELLLKKCDKSINLKNAEGNTALMLSIIHKDIEIVKIILNYYPDIDFINNSGKNALAIAKKMRRKEILELLNNYGI